MERRDVAGHQGQLAPLPAACEGPLLALCHEYRRSTRRYSTVREMKEDPSRSAINRANNLVKVLGYIEALIVE